MRPRSEVEPVGELPRSSIKRHSAVSAAPLRMRRGDSDNTRVHAAQKKADADASNHCADRVAALLAKAGYGFEPIPSTVRPKRR